MKQKTSMTTKDRPKAGTNRHAGSPSAETEYSVYQTQPPVPERGRTGLRHEKSQRTHSGMTLQSRKDVMAKSITDTVTRTGLPDRVSRKQDGSRLTAGRLTRDIVEENITPEVARPTGVCGRKATQPRVLVLNSNKTPAMPCPPARACQLLNAGKAAVIRLYPFTIVLKYSTQETQTVQTKLDPGAKTTGIALVSNNKILWSAELTHRGWDIRDGLRQRRQQRRSRRQRKTRYRQTRFLNRKRCNGWLPPSTQNRVIKTRTWISRLRRLVPVNGITIEHVKFDTQLMENPEITGVEYQQGTLWGYEIREFVLERDGRHCAYCGRKNRPLTLDHIIPRAQGGSNRVGNLTPACMPCNQEKGNRTAVAFGHPNIAPKSGSMAAAAATNAIRWALVEEAKKMELPIEYGSGALTKMNRMALAYPKAHWIDAACAGISGGSVKLNPTMQYLEIIAMPRNNRRMVRPDKAGFPSGAPKGCSTIKGFRTGDFAKASVPSGKKIGTWFGRVATRKTGSFRVGTKDGIAVRCLQKIQSCDGFDYRIHHPAPPQPQAGVSTGTKAK